MDEWVDSVSESYRELMSNWSTGVSIVTAYDEGQPAGCTISSLTSVSAEPPLLLIGLGRASRMFRILIEAETFCVNILAADQGHLSSRFASEVDHIERFSEVDVTPVAGAPAIHGCVAIAICAVHTQFVVGDRVLLVGKPIKHALARHRRPVVLFRRSLAEVHPCATSPNSKPLTQR